MIDDLIRSLSIESVSMLCFSLLTVGIFILFLLIMCYNCICLSNQEDVQYSQAPVSEIEKEVPKLLLKENPIVVKSYPKKYVDGIKAMETHTKDPEKFP